MQTYVPTNSISSTVTNVVFGREDVEEKDDEEEEATVVGCSQIYSTYVKDIRMLYVMPPDKTNK